MLMADYVRCLAVSSAGSPLCWRTTGSTQRSSLSGGRPAGRPVSGGSVGRLVLLGSLPVESVGPISVGLLAIGPIG